MSHKVAHVSLSISTRILALNLGSSCWESFCLSLTSCGGFCVWLKLAWAAVSPTKGLPRSWSVSSLTEAVGLWLRRKPEIPLPFVAVETAQTE